MSALDDVRDQATVALKDLGSNLADRFLSGLKEILDGAPAEACQKVEDLVRMGYSFQRKALVATSEKDAADYQAGVTTVGKRIRTVLLAEGLVKENETASLIGDVLEAALGGFVAIAKGLVVAVAKAAVEGAVSEGDIFPFA